MHLDTPARIAPRWRVALAAVSALGLASCLAIVYGYVPAYGPGSVGPGDAWTFDVLLPGSVTLQADSDGPDLVLELYDATGRFIASGDDEIDCSSPLPCGYACPQIQLSLDTGSYFVVVRDYGGDPAEACPGGDYTLTIETPGGSSPLPTTQVLDDDPVATPDGRVPSKD